MKIRFTCRHTQLTEPLREFAEEKILRLSRYLDDDIQVQVVLTVEKHRHEAEMAVASSLGQFTGAAITSDLYTSLSLVLDKIQKQLRREKRRRTDRRRRATRSLREPQPAPAPRSGRRRKQTLATPLPKPQPAAPMTVEEAALDLEQSARDFLVFRNVTSDRMSVVYRKPDGQLGLIEAD